MNLPSTRPLTDRQELVLTFIRTYRTEKGYAPSIREIAKAIGIRSTNGVNDHLTALERKGYIERDSMKSRGIRSMHIAPADVDNARAENVRLRRLLALAVDALDRRESAAADVGRVRAAIRAELGEMGGA